MFHQISLPPAVDSPAGRRRQGTRTPEQGAEGRERARPGAALTSSTVSGMQIRYSFSSMVLPAAGPRNGKRGVAPQNNKADAQAQGKTRGASLSLGAGRRSSPGDGLSSWLPCLRPRACQGLGLGVLDSSASFLAEVGPPGTRRFKVRDGGRKPR